MTQKAESFLQLLGLGADAQPSERSHHPLGGEAPSHTYSSSPPMSPPTGAEVAPLVAAPMATVRRRAKPRPQRSQAELQNKRKRHADAERERIHRKQSEIARMRELVDRLEQQLRSLSVSSPASGQNFAPVLPWNLDDELSDEAIASERSAEEKREMVIRALTHSGWLRREKASLQAQLDDYGLLEATIESLLKDLIDATIVEPTPPPSERQALEDEAIRRISYRDVLSDECYEMMRDLVSESKRFNIHPDGAGDNVNALDWSAMCRHDGDDVRFSLTKTFPKADMHELTSSVWLAFHDLSASQKIFSPTLRVEILQRVNEDVLIVRWHMDCRKVVPYVGHCRNLVFRWKTHDGYFVGCRTIDDLEPLEDIMATRNPTEGAFDQFYWAKFTHDPDDHGCRVTFAGRVGIGNGTSAFARFLCTEIPIIIFRWESMVLGPLFNLSSTAEV